MTKGPRALFITSALRVLDVKIGQPGQCAQIGFGIAPELSRIGGLFMLNWSLEFSLWGPSPGTTGNSSRSFLGTTRFFSGVFVAVPEHLKEDPHQAFHF